MQLGHWETFAARQTLPRPRRSGGCAGPRRGGIGSGPSGRGVPVRPRVLRHPRPREHVGGQGERVVLRRVHGLLHGATCSSAPEPAEIPATRRRRRRRRARGDARRPARRAIYDSRVRPEVPDRRGDRARGAARGRFGGAETSAGWAAMPAVGPGGAEPTGRRAAARAPGIAAVPDVGRPRAGQHPPSQLGRAKLHFVHGCPRAQRRRSSRRTGHLRGGARVLRFDADGELTSDVDAVTTTLTSPLLAPTRAVSLSGMRVNLPKRDGRGRRRRSRRRAPRRGCQAPGRGLLVATPRRPRRSQAMRHRADHRAQRQGLWANWPRRSISPPTPGFTETVLRSDAIVLDVPQDVPVVLVVEVLYRAPGSGASRR